jgi:hypothetical protein
MNRIVAGHVLVSELRPRRFLHDRPEGDERRRVVSLT